MNKTELVAAMASKADLSKKDAEAALKALQMLLQKNSRRVRRSS